MKTLQKALSGFNAQNRWISIVFVADPAEGLKKAKEILERLVNPKTLLFLSGGKTPKNLYKDFAKEKKIKPGAVAIIDERFGRPFHKNSNERMINETGFLKYLQFNNIRFYSILENKNIGENAKDYDETVRFLLLRFPNSVGILGIGKDGHTAGIAPDTKDFKNPIFSDKSSLVSFFDDNGGEFGKRITLTFKALELLDVIIILAFGKDKKQAFSKMFKEGEIEEIPSHFYLSAGVSEKTVLITDQKI